MKLVKGYYQITYNGGRGEASVRKDVIDQLRAKTTFTLECLPEDMPVRGNLIASGDADADKRDEDDVIDKLNRGFEWAWCCAKVTATYSQFQGTDYLGGCSYDSEESFRDGGGYFEDMCAQAFDEMVDRMLTAQSDLRKAFGSERAS